MNKYLKKKYSPNEFFLSVVWFLSLFVLIHDKTVFSSAQRHSSVCVSLHVQFLPLVLGFCIFRFVLFHDKAIMLTHDADSQRLAKEERKWLKENSKISP